MDPFQKPRKKSPFSSQHDLKFSDHFRFKRRRKCLGEHLINPTARPFTETPILGSRLPLRRDTVKHALEHHLDNIERGRKQVESPLHFCITFLVTNYSGLPTRWTNQ